MSEKPSLDTLQKLMELLDGANREQVNRTAMEYGSLPTRLAMLGLSSIRKGHSSLWWGYPPGVFISYKWQGDKMADYVTQLAAHIRKLGYHAYLDRENLDDNADAYFQIPEFITSMQYCTFYILLLTKAAADLIFARDGKTTWIHDEYQHAIRMSHAGRLVVVPVLVESGGINESFPRSSLLDLTGGTDDFPKLQGILTPNPLRLTQPDIAELERVVTQFDTRFLNQEWDASFELLKKTPHLAECFDHMFRSFLHAIYTGDQEHFDKISDKLVKVYGDRLTAHFYRGYCELHGIPNRLN